ncbi:hypothetical protein P4637_08410 [Halalkalibacterium halodurans]|uniref:hypothetical protein n=1 Tax=Halalkalibacterium halodurans TaxID=86665 RepID=UPI002E207C0B|nr:hypothetical protein [Halalkalibacterium halodurans]MED4084860.1 hypothetical protein [Halalkalibacterium halodurans]MED4103452.1 hypothetical protein [Halalkalibacterium halodurans]MED4107772.1 hypothetical protein [Halalkalibacterium halodurans]MED4123812.1 hypothetical protein [Halalkalibacterium halodurans]
MSKKWKIILGLVVVLFVGGYVMTNITQDEAQEIEKEVNRVHGEYTTIEIFHIEKVGSNRILVFYKWGVLGKRFTVAELKKTLFGWNYKSGFSIDFREKRRFTALNELGIMVGLVPSDDYHEIKIETSSGDMQTATILENERGTKTYWFYVVEEVGEFQEIFNASVYAVTEDGEVIEEIEKPDNEPLY